ncbi:hypothetical protein POX_c03954 [Penicillium oxalicum]|uniref:Uncharacterized protein n=1 Tax=Penicillium oxalicum (strain 114-2 / CGMCC 5302) TaxID=933388 RepID=S8AUP5_PENO1|nr:hypothetical protein POX_c03954 [Penicillium oxalicum]EPS25577.1 hypothetical protein PDE_00511 [Penicillium oxalicum 114-2]KAI2791099.1 hypothetical protein POX_c03954 [Penicillium oxalicum]
MQEASRLQCLGEKKGIISAMTKVTACSIQHGKTRPWVVAWTVLSSEERPSLSSLATRGALDTFGKSPRATDMIFQPVCPMEREQTRGRLKMTVDTSRPETAKPAPEVAKTP